MIRLAFDAGFRLLFTARTLPAGVDLLHCSLQFPLCQIFLYLANGVRTRNSITRLGNFMSKNEILDPV